MTSTSTYSEQSASPEQPINIPISLQAEMNNLPERQPPLSDRCCLHGEKLTQGQVWVIAHQTALKQINDHANSNLNSELGGALVGQVYRYQSMMFVEVKAAIPVVSVDRGPIHFTFSADAWPQIQRDRDMNYPDLDIVGWFHTHPDLGVFYSSDDVVVHSAAFTQPWHVGLVVDPVRYEASFFGWIDGKLSSLTGFYELLDDEQTDSSIDWRVVPTEVWDESYVDDVYGDAQLAQMPITAVSHAEMRSVSNFALVSMGVGLMGLMVSLFLIFGWVWPMSRQIANLEGLTLLMADEAGVNTAICPNPNIRILSPVNGDRISAGTDVSIIGVAQHSEANRFLIESRLINVDEAWAEEDIFRGDTQLGKLGVWRTDTLGAATYELRITAVDRSNIPLDEDAARCTIELTLTN